MRERRERRGRERRTVLVERVELDRGPDLLRAHVGDQARVDVLLGRLALAPHVDRPCSGKTSAFVSLRRSTGWRESEPDAPLGSDFANWSALRTTCCVFLADRISPTCRMYCRTMAGWSVAFCVREGRRQRVRATVTRDTEDVDAPAASG